MDFVTFLEQNWFIIGGLISFGGFIWKISRDITKSDGDRRAETKEIKDSINDLKEDFQKSQAEMNQRIDDHHKMLSDRLDKMENQRIEASERTRIIMDGVEATLSTLADEGHNGPVSKSLECIKEYKSKKAAQ